MRDVFLDQVCDLSSCCSLLLTAYASTNLQRCEWHRALSLAVAACHALARPAAALCLVHSCSQPICAACKVLQGHANQRQADAASLPRA